MTTMMPNVPMALVQPPTADGANAGQRTFTCYTAPGAVFHSEEDMKEHYRSDWHRYNLKRKVAGLAPLHLAAYEERAAREEAAAPAAAAATSGASRSQQRRLKREAKQEAKAKQQAANPHSKAAHFEATKSLSEHEYVELKMSSAESYDLCSDLFSRHRSASLEANLAHMAKAHGFYIPYADYVTDLSGLLGYLLEMVYVGNVALLSGKQFHSLEAVQGHMRDRRECRMELEGHEEEYAAWYDLEALALKSPLWEWVEEDESEDDDNEGWEDEEAEGMEGVEEEEASGSAAAASSAAVPPPPAVDVTTLGAEELEEMLSEVSCLHRKPRPHRKPCPHRKPPTTTKLASGRSSRQEGSTLHLAERTRRALWLFSRCSPRRRRADRSPARLLLPTALRRVRAPRGPL